jgi:hypothetical protein
MSTYYKSRIAAQIIDRVQSSYFPTEEQSLDKELKQLDVATKKRLLGMPLTDNDYEQAVNQDKDFLQKNYHLMGVGASALTKTARKMPELRHFEKPSAQPAVSAAFKYVNSDDILPALKYFKKIPSQKSTLAGVLKYVRR